jgi:tetratricopeptide (TPR) repeat protein
METGDRLNESNVLNNIGTTLCRMDQCDESLIHHQKALSVADEIDNVYERTRAILGIGDANATAGRYTASLDNYRICQRMSRQIGDPYLEARALSGVASATQHTKGQDAARIYWRQAYDLYNQIGVPEAEFARIRLESLGPSDS